MDRKYKQTPLFNSIPIIFSDMVLCHRNSFDEPWIKVKNLCTNSMWINKLSRIIEIGPVNCIEKLAYLTKYNYQHKLEPK